MVKPWSGRGAERRDGVVLKLIRIPFLPNFEDPGISGVLGLSLPQTNERFDVRSNVGYLNLGASLAVNVNQVCL